MFLITSVGVNLQLHLAVYSCAHFLRRSLSLMLASVIGMFVSGVLRYFFPSHHCASIKKKLSGLFIFARHQFSDYWFNPAGEEFTPLATQVLINIGQFPLFPCFKRA